ncbi:MAG: hypothetical protein IJZ73_06260 [Clostridia bacterium]|nr:hypothetical protein [Clostridia bacterium]
MNKDLKTANENLIDEYCDDTCDLDPNKICDSCGKCIEETANYKVIKITKIIEEQ